MKRREFLGTAIGGAVLAACTTTPPQETPSTPRPTTASPAPVAPVVPRRVVPVGRAAAEVESETTTRPSKGRALLPDIEEINSTLSPMSNPGEPAELAPSAPRRGSFGRGFMLMILLGMIALTVYVTAPRITQRFPAVAGPVNAYVAGVDTLRVKLDVARFNREQGGTTRVDAYERFLRWRDIVMREQFDVDHDRERLRLAREMVALDPACVLCQDALA